MQFNQRAYDSFFFSCNIFTCASLMGPVSDQVMPVNIYFWGNKDNLMFHNDLCLLSNRSKFDDIQDSLSAKIWPQLPESGKS